MNMKPIHVLVITGYGINCQEETACAWELCGARALIAHLEDLVEGHVELRSFDAMVLPGGFSYGDHLGSGKALANKITHARLKEGRTLREEIMSFVDRGGHVLGICNGFQVLVKSGLLPGHGDIQECSLCQNMSGRFEDRWVRLKVSSRAAGGFLGGLESLFLPVRHGEGRFIARDASTLKRIEEEDLIVLQYAGSDGSPTMTYPENPNGSQLAIAGISDTTGRIIGIMPHPEAFLFPENHPYWTRLRETGTAMESDGLKFFRALSRKIQIQKGEITHDSESTDLCVR